MAAAQPANFDELLRTPNFGSYDNVLSAHLTNNATRQGFNMDNLGMMDFNNLNSMLSEYKRKSRANAPRFLSNKIHQLLALHKHGQVNFLCGQAVTEDYILPVFSKIEHNYMSASAVIGTELKYVKSFVTPVFFNFAYKFIPLLSHWEVVITPMKSVIDKSKLDYLPCSRRSYTPTQTDALAANIFEYSFTNIEITGSAFTDDNSRAHDALIPGIFGTLAEQVLTATINSKNDFQ